jgi:hypothetical protein
MGDKIQTQHPDPKKQGVNIERSKYDAVQAAIVDALNIEGELTFNELMKAVEQRLGGHFEGSINWYFTAVKLDLEARGVIEVKAKSSPQRIRLAK